MDTWTISELAERAAAALADLEVNGRVQDVPNERLIRWYTTLGLLDPPLRRGRTARYTPRHLLQLVAVKRRQAAGRTLAEIQAELTGAPTETLLALTGPLPGLPHPVPQPSPSAPRRFWAASPAPSPPGAPSAARPPAPEPEGAARHTAESAETADIGSCGGSAAPGREEAVGVPDVRWTTGVVRGDPAEVPRSVALQGVVLAPGVTLLLETAALGEEELSALRAAAEPLLAELAGRGLLPEASGRREGLPHLF